MKINGLIAFPRAQRGATLIVTMIFLVLLTFLGVSTIQDTALEEKMAANLRFKDIVFQEAESILRNAEFMLSQPGLGDFDNTNGRYDEDFDLSVFDDCSSSSFNGTSWAAYSNSAGFESGYVTKEAPVLGLSDSAEVGVAQDDQKLYYITACVRSNNTSAVVVLQSTYSR